MKQSVCHHFFKFLPEMLIIFFFNLYSISLYISLIRVDKSLIYPGLILMLFKGKSRLSLMQHENFNKQTKLVVNRILPPFSFDFRPHFFFTNSFSFFLFFRYFLILILQLFPKVSKSFGYCTILTLTPKQNGHSIFHHY